MTASMKQKLDAVSELGRVLHHKVDSVCSQASPNRVADPSVPKPQQQQQPDASDVVRALREEIDCVSGTSSMLQKELESVSSRAYSTSPSSCWPKLQKKLAELEEQVNDIDASQRHSRFLEGSPSGSGNSSPHGSGSGMDMVKTDSLPALVPTALVPRATATPPVGGNDSTPVETLRLRTKLESVLQGLQEADRSFYADLSAATSVEAAPSLVSNLSWWGELQDKHPDLAHLLEAQRSELVRIAGSQGSPPTPNCEEQTSFTYSVS